MAKTKKYKAVLFDLDNTLIDFWRLKRVCVEASLEAMKRAGLKMDHDKAEKALYDLYKKYGIEYEEIFQKFLKKVNKKVDYRIMANGIVAYRQIRAGFLVSYPGVKETLKKLKRKKLKLGVVSDAPRVKAWIRLASLGIDEYFDTVITFDDTKKSKPSKRPFTKALKELKVKPQDCLMVGDNPERDLYGAAKLKMDTCFASYGFDGTILKDFDKVKADCTIKRFEEILKLV